MEFLVISGVILVIGFFMSIMLYVSNRSQLAKENELLRAAVVEMDNELNKEKEKYAALVDSLREDCLLNTAKRLQDIPIVGGKAPYVELYRSLVHLSVILMEDDHNRAHHNITRLRN